MTSQEKKEAKETYAYLMSLSRTDFDTYEEYIQEKKDVSAELKALLGVEDLDEVESLLYSKNQIQFINDARNCGQEIVFTYSGRGMCGDTCPSVVLERGEKFRTKSDYEEDSMGLGRVIYARN